LLRKHIPDEVFDRWEGHLCGKTEFETADALIDALRGP
jgi:hypothetical protein